MLLFYWVCVFLRLLFEIVIIHGCSIRGSSLKKEKTGRNCVLYSLRVYMRLGNAVTSYL